MCMVRWPACLINLRGHHKESMTILAFAHPGIVVLDQQKAIAFYEKMFGFKIIGTESW